MRELDECLAGAQVPFTATLDDFAVHPVADGVAQATYVSELRGHDSPVER